MRYIQLILLAWLATGSISLVNARPNSCLATSGANRVTLVELYTSEGCSSCPPADSWLRRLPEQDFAGKNVVPLSFHVDYWDYIGWADRFAKKQYTQRQRNIAGINQLSTIYTPQVVVNGRDYRYWSWGGRIENTVARIADLPPGAKLDILLKHDGTTRLLATSNVMLLPQSHPRQTSVFMALYHNKQSTQVRAGENAGKQLRHDFVVRELRGPFSISGKSAKIIEQDFYLDKTWNPADIGVAVFVQDQNNGEVLQALSSSGCRKLK